MNPDVGRFQLVNVTWFLNGGEQEAALVIVYTTTGQCWGLDGSYAQPWQKSVWKPLPKLPDR